MGSALPLNLMTPPSVCGTRLTMFLPNIPSPLIQYNLIFIHGQTQMVGSMTQKVAYYIGYPQTVVPACIHTLFWQSLLYLVFGQFLLILTILPMEPLGPKFSTVHSSSLSFLLTLCCSWWIITLQVLKFYSILPSAPYFVTLGIYKMSSIYEIWYIWFPTYSPLSTSWEPLHCLEGILFFVIQLLCVKS